MILNKQNAMSHDQWLKTPEGCYIDARQKELILDLTAPRQGETLLDVGCGNGNHLLFFHMNGCNVTGVDSSLSMLEMARQKLGDKVDLHLGAAEDLPFSDNEFDIVSLIASLEFAADPEKAISEAIRVCRGRIFLGVLNRYSVTGVRKSATAFFHPISIEHARFFHIGELMVMIRRFLPGVRIRWGSVIFLPAGWYEFAAKLDKAIPVMGNPFGAFLGFSFPVVFTVRTAQNIISDPFKIRAESGRPVQGIIREGCKCSNDQGSHAL
jgi:SAM-dependent methyltransferase